MNFINKDSVLTLKDNRNVNHSGEGLLLDQIKPKSFKSYNQSIKIGAFFRFSEDYLIGSEKYFSNENLCKICYDTVLNQTNSFKFDQSHIYCFNCIKKYAKFQILDGKEKIKCPKVDCKVYKSDIHFFKLFLDNIEMCLVEKILKRKELITYKNNMDLIQCPYPDCEELIKNNYKLDKNYEICSKGHRFCADCKKNCGMQTICKNVRI